MERVTGVDRGGMVSPEGIWVEIGAKAGRTLNGGGFLSPGSGGGIEGMEISALECHLFCRVYGMR
ncbi:MAG: hypothetical protein M0Z96_06200 [Actinomycetota bacterium]|nr:hypothetical protein [Actinomycetota bacterium]